MRPSTPNGTMTQWSSRMRLLQSTQLDIRNPASLITKINGSWWTWPLSKSGVAIMFQLISRAPWLKSRNYIPWFTKSVLLLLSLLYVELFWCIPRYVLLFYTNICCNEKGKCRMGSPLWSYRSYIQYIHSAKLLSRVIRVIIILLFRRLIRVDSSIFNSQFCLSLHSTLSSCKWRMHMLFSVFKTGVVTCGNGACKYCMRLIVVLLSSCNWCVRLSVQR